MRFASLGSGSRGNATLVEWRDTTLMVDCGFSVRDTVARLERLGKQPQDISAILVTHEHSDHWKGVLPLARRFAIPVYLTSGCLRSREITEVDVRCEIIDSHNEFLVGDLKVIPVPVPHDAREPVQFIFESRRQRLGVLTDLGSVTPHITQQYASCDGLLLEANHDLDMLAEGPYPAFLKERVGGHWGHLNNQQAGRLLADLDGVRLRQLVVGHISEKNNAIHLVKEAIEPNLPSALSPVYATQNQGFDWLTL